LAPEGFKTLIAAETYTEDNLYNKIDGKAPLYTDAGFVKLTTQRYISIENEELTFETYIYDMGEIKNAFTVYSQQKRPDSLPVTGLKFGYSTENSAYLVHGKYYCEIVGASYDAKLKQAVIQISQKLPEILTQAGKTEIEELKMFPSENLIPDSQKLYQASAFGCSALNNVFTANYKVGDSTMTAYISDQSDNNAAKKMFDAYKYFLIENGGEIIKSKNPNVIILDIFGLNEMIVVKDNYVFGIHEFEPSPTSEELFRLIFNNLGGTNK
jgi:hypothetical protein